MKTFARRREPSRLLARAILLALAGCDATSPDRTAPARVVVEAPDSILNFRATLQLTATVYTESGDPVPDAPIAWTTSDPSIANVSASGVLSGRRAGQVSITAWSGTHSGALALALVDRDCRIRLPALLRVGTTRTFGTGISEAGFPVVGPSAAVTSSNSAVATISDGPSITTHRTGRTVLHAACEGGAPDELEIEVVAGYRMTHLGTLGGAGSIPHDLNEAGEVVGESTTGDGAARAFLWRDGRLTDLGVAGRSSRAVAISENGLVAGSYTEKSGDEGWRPFLWSAGVATRLDPEPQEANVFASDVNSAGRVVGYSQTPNADATVESALYWSNGVRTDLGRMGGQRSRLLRVDEAGRMLGLTSSTPVPFGGVADPAFVLEGAARVELRPGTVAFAGPDGFAGHAPHPTESGHLSFVQKGGLTSACFLGRRHSVRVTDANAAGSAVATAQYYNETRTFAALCDRTTVVPLDEMVIDGTGWSLSQAMGINDRGQIIAVARETSSGRTSAVLLTLER